MLASVLLRQLVHESRMVQLSVMIEDRPGFLARVAGVVGQAGGNIVQVHHERLHGSGGVRSATLEILVETQDERHAAEIVAELTEAGYSVHRDAHTMMPFE